MQSKDLLTLSKELDENLRLLRRVCKKSQQKMQTSDQKELEWEDC